MKAGSTSQTIEWHIISRRINDEPLTQEEELRFNQWLAESPSHHEYYRKAVRANNFLYGPPPQIDIHHMLAQLDKAAGITQPRRPQLRLIISVAASLAFAIITATALLIIGHDSNTLNPQQTITDCSDIHPATTRASLILPDGNTIDIYADTHRTLGSDALGGYLHIADGNVTCSAQYGIIHPYESSTTIAVPRGGMYGLTLSDGTKVWLNANTCLSFPTVFNTDTRTVELDGEAYFEVAHDPAKPFIVKTSISNIRVHGTKFNVRSHIRDRSQQTTLVTGSVSIEYEGIPHMLKPGQQARITVGTENIRITEVDPHASCSWIDGLFIFENMPLHEILTQLSDWYDVDFIYSNPTLRHLHFTGDLERYADFNEILTLIEMTTSVHFATDGRTVTVSPR